MPIRVPYLRVANVLRGRLDLAEIKEINCSQPELDRTRLQPKDLLVVEGHGNPNEIGRVAMWTEQPGEMVHQNHLIRVRSKASSLDPEFLCFYLNSRMGRRHLLKRANTTSGLNTISTSVVKSAPIVVPPIDEQRSFCETIKIIAQLEKSLLVSSALHAQLSRSLLSESFDL
jgi:type I restriction enzyme S subunit